VTQPLWIPAYVGVGSNLDDPARQVERALAALGRIRGTKLCAESRLYRSPPLGPQDQPDFVNAAAGMLTRLSERELLGALQDIERTLGRPAKRQRWGPRCIDLDLLLYGRSVMMSSELTLPHPGLTTRSFVLYPLADFAPDVEVPGLGTIRELARRTSSGELAIMPSSRSESN
jgi:2-amino-4-hydroxy-6-hydroxymethyldihydropteridine diphosphokinase